VRGVASLQSALIDATLDGICLSDADGNILISNRPLRKLVVDLGMPSTGSVPERLIAISGSITEPERYRQRMLEIAGEPGAASTDEFEIAGTGRVFRGYTAPVPDTPGGFHGRIWTLREVTADRELDRMRDAFVATVSHELRTPLTSISGFLEMMLDEEHELGESGRQYLDVIRRSTDRLHTLVEDLLLIAQIEAHRIELTIAAVDLGDLARSTVEAARPAAADKGVEVDVRVDSPPAVQGDVSRLGQVARQPRRERGEVHPRGRAYRRHRGSRRGECPCDRRRRRPSASPRTSSRRSSRASSARRRRRSARSRAPASGSRSRGRSSSSNDGTISLSSREGEGTEITVSLPGTR